MTPNRSRLLAFGAFIAASALVTALATGCGGDQASARRNSQRFTCNDRIASYVATKTLGSGESGVLADCGEAGPRLRRWLVRDDGTRVEDTRGLTPAQFDRLWGKFEGSGWLYLKDCPSGAPDTEPTYTFHFKDWNGENKFSCRGLELAFPYDSIRSELDIWANQGRNDLDPAADPNARGKRPSATNK